MNEPITNAADRVARAMGQVQNPHVCEKCGSSHFSIVPLNRFAQGRYSAAPGGDIQPIDENNLDVLVCLCGYPKMPNLAGGRQMNARIAAMVESVKAARRHLDSMTTAAQLGAVIDRVKLVSEQVACVPVADGGAQALAVPSSAELEGGAAAVDEASAAPAKGKPKK